MLPCPATDGPLPHVVRAARVALLALTGCVLLTIVPTPSLACSKLQIRKPEKRWPRKQLAPLAVGDSTMILAAPHLARHGYHVNAKGCRSMEDGVRLISQHKRQGRLPHMVLLALGANHNVSWPQLRRALRVLGPERVLVLVTPIELGGSESDDARNERRFATVHGQRVILLDWYRHSRNRHGWLNADHLHPTDLGARKYGNFLARALDRAMPPARPLPDVTGSPTERAERAQGGGRIRSHPVAPAGSLPHP